MNSLRLSDRIGIAIASTKGNCRYGGPTFSTTPTMPDASPNDRSTRLDCASSIAVAVVPHAVNPSSPRFSGTQMNLSSVITRVVEPSTSTLES